MVTPTCSAKQSMGRPKTDDAPADTAAHAIVYRIVDRLLDDVAHCRTMHRTTVVGLW